MRLVIVRHGNTFEAGELPRRVGSRTDLPLTEAGLAQAEALAEHFSATGVRFDEAFSGPLTRTRQTAERIIDQLPIGTAEFLAEIDHGPDEDRPEAEVLARIGADALAGWEHDLIPPPGWDVRADWRIAAWQEFVAARRDRPKGHTVLLVTSNGAARFALVALGLSAQDAKLRTGSYGVIEIEADSARLLAWNVRPGDVPAQSGLV